MGKRLESLSKEQVAPQDVPKALTSNPWLPQDRTPN